MTALLLPALSGALIVAGLIGVVWGLQRHPEAQPAPKPTQRRVNWWSSPPRWVKIAAAISAGVGVVVFLATGWFLAIVLLPLAVFAIPLVLMNSTDAGQIRRLDAMAEWTRNLAGVLTVGVGLEQALVATLRSTPDAIRPEVGQLVARLRARWSTEDALRTFADELDDPTGDLIAANLILGARRRGAGLSAVLQGLAESVTADVMARRQIEADRAKPRATARNVTLISAAVLIFFALSGQFLAPYGTPLGQALLALLLTLYGAALVWMRRMTLAKPMPRLLGSHLRGAR